MKEEQTFFTPCWKAAWRAFVPILLISTFGACASRPSPNKGSNVSQTGDDTIGMLEERVRNLDATLSPKVSQDELIGSYAKPGKSFREHLRQERIGPVLAGHILNLLGDGTYRHDYWADIWPRRACDQGTWRYETGIITLISDNSIKGITKLDDMKYVPMFLSHGTNRTLLLIGTPVGAHRFVAAAHMGDTDDERKLGLLLLAFERSPAKE